MVAYVVGAGVVVCVVLALRAWARFWRRTSPIEAVRKRGNRADGDGGDGGFLWSWWYGTDGGAESANMHGDAGHSCEPVSDSDGGGADAAGSGDGGGDGGGD